jgi:hypothetical protein
MTTNDRVSEAAAWLSSTPYRQRPRPIVPHLRAEFNLTNEQAVEAIRQSNLRAARAL